MSLRQASVSNSTIYGQGYSNNIMYIYIAQIWVYKENY